MAAFLTLFSFTSTEPECPPQFVYAGYSHQELHDARQAASNVGGIDHFISGTSSGSHLLAPLPATTPAAPAETPSDPPAAPAETPSDRLAAPAETPSDPLAAPAETPPPETPPGTPTGTRKK